MFGFIMYLINKYTMTFFQFMTVGDTPQNRLNIKNDVYGEPRVLIDDDEEKMPALYEESDDDDDEGEEDDEEMEMEDEEIVRIMKKREAIKESEQKAATQAALKQSKVTNINKKLRNDFKVRRYKCYSTSIMALRIVPTQKAIGHAF